MAHRRRRGARELTVKAVDRTLELDLEEKVVAWPGNSDSSIAEAIFAELRPLGRGRGDARRARPGRPRRAPARERPRLPALARREVGLRRLPRGRGAAASPATSARSTRSPSRRASSRFGFGGDARASQASAQLAAGRRVLATADPGALRHRAERRGGTATTRRRGPVARRRAGDAAARPGRRGRARSTRPRRPRRSPGESAFAARLTAELDTARVGLLVRARRPILVQGLGSSLSGRYLVERVRHEVTPQASPPAGDAHPQRPRADRRRAVRRVGARRPRVMDRFHGKYVGHRRRQRRPEAAVPDPGAGARGLRRGDQRLVPALQPLRRLRASGWPRCRPVGSLVFVEWPAGDIDPGADLVGRHVAGRRRRSTTPGRTRSCWSRRAGTGSCCATRPAARRSRSRRRRARSWCSTPRGVSARVRQPEDRDHARVGVAQRRRAGGDVMPGFVLDAGASIVCPHGGQGAPSTTAVRVKLGGKPPLLVTTSSRSPAAPSTSPGAPSPCLRVQWLMPATTRHGRGRRRCCSRARSASA